MTRSDIEMSEMATNEQNELKRKNILLALAFGAFALIVFLTSFPFWIGLFGMVGGQIK